MKRKYLIQDSDCLRDGYVWLDSPSFVVHLPSHVMVPGILSSGVDFPGVKVAPHHHLVSRLRILGAIPALPPYIYMTYCLIEGREYLLLPRRVVTTFILLKQIQGHRKRWTGFETAITKKVLDGFTRLAS